MQILLFYIPSSSNAEATLLGKMIVENRLAACANIFPIQSIFPWDGSIQNENEFVLVLKTTSSMKNKIIEVITSHHSYEVPCIMSWNVEVNDSYGQWVKGNVSDLE